MPKLAVIEYVGSSDAFKKLGFTVTKNNEVQLDEVVIRCNCSNENSGRGLTRLGFSGLPLNIKEIAGVPVFAFNPTTTMTTNMHRNTAFTIDHVVIYSSDEDSTINSFNKAGIPLKKRIELFQDVVQLFFRPGNGTILEVLVNKGTHHDQPLWGLTIAVKNIETARKCLCENEASNIRPARQKNRQILTIRHEVVGLFTNMALMSEHIREVAKL